jgi:cardiolipin synthase A/B
MDTKTDNFFSKKNIRKIYGAHFSDYNKVTLLWREHESFRKIFDVIRSANELICLAFYIYRDDETGKELAGILKQKAAEGVKVYLIYDHFGSIGTPWKFWKDMRDAGIQIKASHPFKWSSPLHYIHRDHRKLIIIDGSVAFIGGLNIANEYRGYFLKRKKGWRDTGIFLEGPVATLLLDQFTKSWMIWGGTPITFHKEISPVTDGIPALPVFANSARDRRRMRKLIYYSINYASKNIYLTTAYFAPSRRMLQVLENAVKRGVDVKLLLPGKSDIYAVSYAGRAFFTKLLRAGVRIYTYEGEILHAKTAVFDEVWSIIGSANLDFQSLRRNDEGNVGIVDRAFGSQMVEIFNEDLKNSTEIILENWVHRPLIEKLKEHFFALFRRRL